METHTRRQYLAGGTALALALAGCSLADSAESGGSGLPDTVEVVMTSTPRIAFEPRIAHVAVGGTVVWRLESGSHDATAYHPETKGPRRGQESPLRIPPDATPWASPTLSAVGETYEWTFELPGIYDYVDTEAVCTSHAMVGNVGRVVVGWPDPAGQPALEPPQESLPALVRDKIRELNPQTRDLLAERPTEAGDT